MESPLRNVRGLAYAARMLGSADDMPKEPGEALNALAELIVDKMDELIEERERLCISHGKEPNASHDQISRRWGCLFALAG